MNTTLHYRKGMRANGCHEIPLFSSTLIGMRAGRSISVWKATEKSSTVWVFTDGIPKYTASDLGIRRRYGTNTVPESGTDLVQFWCEIVLNFSVYIPYFFLPEKSVCIRFTSTAYRTVVRYRFGSHPEYRDRLYRTLSHWHVTGREPSRLRRFTTVWLCSVYAATIDRETVLN